MRSLWICVSILFVSKTSLSINPEVDLQWTNESCIGGERGLLSTSIWITFDMSGEWSERKIVRRSTHRQMIEYNSSLYIPDLDSYLANYFTVSNTTIDFE